MEIAEIITLDNAILLAKTGLMLIGTASVILKYIAPKTKTILDDRAYEWLQSILGKVSLQVDEHTVTVNVKR